MNATISAFYQLDNFDLLVKKLVKLLEQNGHRQSSMQFGHVTLQENVKSASKLLSIPAQTCSCIWRTHESQGKFNKILVS